MMIYFTRTLCHMSEQDDYSLNVVVIVDRDTFDVIVHSILHSSERIFPQTPSKAERVSNILKLIQSCALQ